jgi:hypothetical protein
MSSSFIMMREHGNGHGRERGHGQGKRHRNGHGQEKRHRNGHGHTKIQMLDIGYQ